MIKNAQDNSFFIPSVTYNAVRSRQLEGDYPGDPQTACWPITTLRVRRGWGDVPQEAWPNSALKSWPPYEPPGLDQIAREYRIFRYQRIRTANECWNALRRRCPVMASFEITQQWFDAKDGVIQVPEENAPTVGTHMISIMGAEERFTILPGSERRRFVFDNCWGPDWGIQGRGFLPSELFKRWLVEAWTFDLISPEKEKHNETYWTLPGIISEIQYVGEINGSTQDERLAWTIVTRRQDCLDVEELFVKPAHRRKGFGTRLLTSLKELSRKQELPLRFVIPFSDSDSENLRVIQRILERIGHRVEVSGARWAPYFGISAPGPDVKPYFPQKPQLARPQSMHRVHPEGISVDSGRRDEVTDRFMQAGRGRGVQEILDDIARNRFKADPDGPSVVDMLREDRNR